LGRPGLISEKNTFNCSENKKKEATKNKGGGDGSCVTGEKIRKVKYFNSKLSGLRVHGKRCHGIKNGRKIPPGIIQGSNKKQVRLKIPSKSLTRGGNCEKD